MTPIAHARALLARHHTLTLATISEGRPWAASVFYASDDACDLFFHTSPTTRHGRAMLDDPAVSAAINADVSRWEDVVGLQLEGHAARLDGDDRARAAAVYLARFDDVRRVVEAPRSDDERRIGAALAAATFWRLTPTWIRILDASRGFAWKNELRP